MNYFNPQMIYINLIAILIRLWLITSQFRSYIIERIEISTPINSIKRVAEGTYRAGLGINPYNSDIFHESPLHLKFYTMLLSLAGEYLPLVFIFVDILTAYGLYDFSRKYMMQLYVKQETEKHLYAADAEKQLLQGKDFYSPPIYVVVVFLFNPYTIFNCVAMTTTSFTNLLLAYFLVGISSKKWTISVITLSLGIFHSLYPVVLLSPLFLSSYEVFKEKRKAIQLCIQAILYVAALFLLSYACNKSWDFLEHTYGFILQVSDQTPNVGVFWYFFMEMFEHFRLLFLCSYQMNVTVLYLVPLSIKLYRDPPLLAACFITLTAIFKSYPSIGDFAFALALLPCCKHLYNCMQQILISVVTIIVTTILSPILWDLWIYWGSANANFFFGATLAFVTAHIFLVTDISFAYSKRQYLLRYGNCRKINGKEAQLVLE